jgi:glycosyltransferase involved in cell wall biosynthesis
VETFLATLARRQSLVPDLEHRFALCFEGRLSQELVAAGAQVTQLGQVRFSRPLSVLRARGALRKLLRASDDLDAVICHSSWAQALFGRQARASGLPHVFYLHGPIVSMEWVDWKAAKIVPDLMIAVSRDTLSSGRQVYPNVAAEVINYPMPWLEAPVQDVAEIRALRDQLGATASTVVISQMSRMERWKGTDQHLRALAMLRDLSNWICWIAGGAQQEHEKAYRSELVKLVADLQLQDRVRFLGERRDVPKLLAATDILCQANRGPEGFSLAFMEAFTAGRPIVTVDIGGAGEMIDSSCGVLAGPGDIAAIAAGLRRLIGDPVLRKEMGETARQRVRKLCDPATQIGRLRDLVGKLSVTKRGS